MFHPYFNPRPWSVTQSLPFDQFCLHFEAASRSGALSEIEEVLDQSLERVGDDLDAVRALGDRLAELFHCAMRRQPAESISADADPFGLYLRLLQLHPALLESAHNTLLGCDPPALG